MQIKENFLLISIVTLALLLRLLGIYFGYPYALNFDEMQDIPNTLKMLQGVHLKPPHYIHGSFYFYFYEFFALMFFLAGKLLGAFKTAYEIYPVDFIIFCRIISALVGTVTVYLTYRIGRNLFSHNVGIVAALLLCTCLLHVMVSHYATQDALLTLIILLSFYWALKAYKNDHFSDYIVFSFFAGLATATSMTGILSMGVLILVIYHHRRTISIKNILACGATALGTFLVFSPYFLLDYSTYYSDVKFALDFHETGKGAEFASDLNGISTWIWWIKYFTSTGLLWPFSLATVMGILLLIKNKSIHSLLVLSYPILWAVVLLGHSVRYDRHATSLLPFLSLIAAFALIKFYKVCKQHLNNSLADKGLIAISTLIFVCYPLFKATAFGYFLTEKDTSLRATRWIQENITEGANITVMTSRGAEDYSVPFNALTKTHNVLFTHLHFEEFITDPDIYLREGFQYMIVGGDYSNQSVVYRAVYGDMKYNFFENIRKNFKLVAKFEEPWFHNGFFSPRSLERSATLNFNHHRTYEIFSLESTDTDLKRNRSYYYSKVYQKTFTPKFLLKYSAGRLVTDKSSESGESLLYEASPGKEIPIVVGPYENIPVGQYEAIFSLKINDCERAMPVADISIKSGTTKEILSEKTLFCRDFKSTGFFQQFKLSFHNPVSESWNPQIETPLISRGNGNISIEYIEVKGHGLDFSKS